MGLDLKRADTPKVMQQFLERLLLNLLTGVSQADPVVPNSGWFAINATAPGVQAAFAALLAAKVSGTAVHIQTDGTTSCGLSTASWVSSN